MSFTPLVTLHSSRQNRNYNEDVYPGLAVMSFQGAWTIQIATPIGKQQVLLTITDSGDVLEGTATQGNETVPFLQPRIEGNRLRWTQRVTKPMRLTIAFDLARDGDHLIGTAKAGIFPASSVTGARSER
jgi:hypothetical protein